MKEVVHVEMIDVDVSKNINNDEIVEYARAKKEKNQTKEKKDILSNAIFKNLNDVVTEKMNEYYDSLKNDNNDNN